jgi:hypothetical protein
MEFKTVVPNTSWVVQVLLVHYVERRPLPPRAAVHQPPAVSQGGVFRIVRSAAGAYPCQSSPCCEAFVMHEALHCAPCHPCRESISGGPLFQHMRPGIFRVLVVVSHKLLFDLIVCRLVLPMMEGVKV